MNFQPLDRSVLSTLAYFDVFDYPLAGFEVWRWLYKPANSQQQPAISIQQTAISPHQSDVPLFEVLETLDRLQRDGQVESKNGFWFLSGRSALVETRMQRMVMAERKFQRTIRLVRLLRYAPFVRAICVCNTLAYGNARRDSDIDFTVFAADSRVWTARFFTAGFLKLFGLRPTPTKSQDRFCLAFFLSEHRASIEDLKIDVDDPHFTFWLTQFVPLYDEGAFALFWQANGWIRRTLPNAFAYAPSPRRRLDRAGVVKRIIERFSGLIPEALFRSFQLRILPKRLRELANRDTRVVLNDSTLKFHDTDRRTEYEAAFRSKLVRLGLTL